jgi:hypothetical protein
MKFKNLRTLLASAGLAACTAIAAPAYADFTLHYKSDGSGGWQGPAASEPLPTSLQDAIDDGFYYIFDSYYPVKDGSGFIGDLVGLEGDSIIGDIDRFCRLQLGGFIWQDGEDPKLVKIAVTHGRTDKDQPPGSWPEPPTEECEDIQLEFDNGVVRPGYPAASAGAWVAQATAADVNSGSFLGQFENVQVDPTGSGFPYCSNSLGGTGGTIDVTYNENPVGDRVEFDFNATIQSPGSFLSCAVVGTLYSVGVDKGQIVMPNPNDRTPGTAHPSQLSRGVVDHITNP